MVTLVVTKDCTALSDADLAEMAELCGGSGRAFEIGMLSKQAEAWVLVTLARDARDALVGYAFCTLERIGGTPSILIGLASVGRHEHSETVMRSILRDQMRRAVLAFPDEDVLVGSRLAAPSTFSAFAGLNEVIPRPGHKASGEERAWGRRLAKRFGIDTSSYNDRSFTVSGDGSLQPLFDYIAPDHVEVHVEVAALFDPLDLDAGDVLIGFGWAMAEDLDALLKETGGH
jgi:hypothetical protein